MIYDILNAVDKVIAFVRESNAIEGIHRDPTQEEIEEFHRFMMLPCVTVEDLKKFVSVYQPDAKLRDEYGLDVRVGHYVPPMGGPEIKIELEALLQKISGVDRYNAAYFIHVAYEKLHPFTDGNGRSGRALWAYIFKDTSRGFLIPFYFQALEWGECG